MTAKNEADTRSLTAFLRQQRAHAKRALRAASLWGLVGGLLLIAIAWVLAGMVQAGIFANATLASLTQPALILLGLYAARATCIVLAEYYGAHAALQVKSALREEAVSALLTQGPLARAQAQSGTALTQLLEGLDALHGYYARYLPSMTTTVMLPLAIWLLVIPVDLTSAAILLVTAPLIPFFMVLIGRGAEKLNQKQWRTLAHLSGYFLDRVRGLTTLKLFGASTREAAFLARMGEQYRTDTMDVLRVAFLSALALEFFATVSIALVAVLVGFRLLWGQVTFDHAYLVLLLAPEFYLPLRRMGTHYHARMEAIGAAEQLLPLLTRPAPQAATAAAPTHAPRIEFRNITTRYNAEDTALTNLSFTLPAGERLALVGPSGSGKSTVLSLLLGFLQPSEGTILIDGTDLQHIDRQHWWRTIGWVPQQPHLFWGTVEENIRFAHPALTEAQLQQYAAQLDIAFLNQATGEAGSSLSGGQIRRVAMARALARHAPLLLLDEPTANLDAASEQRLTAALSASHAQTMVLAAHRFPAIATCQHILVLAGGIEQDFGSHTALMHRSAYYRHCLQRMGGA